MQSSFLLPFFLTVLVVFAVAKPALHGFPSSSFNTPNAAFPGVQSTVSARGINQIRDTIVEVIRSQLTNVRLPDQSGKVSTPIGHVKYSLTDLILSDPSFGSINIRNDGNGIRLEISGVYVHVHMHWKYKKSPISDSGRAEIDVNNVFIGATLDVVANPSGVPTASIRDVAVSIGSLKIHLHGGASWLYKIFVDVFSHDIKKSVQHAVQSTATSVLNAAIKQSLSDINPIHPLDAYADLDFRVLGTTFSPLGYVNSKFAGNLLVKNDKTRPDIPSYPMPDKANEQMLQLFVGQYALNSAGLVYHVGGALKGVLRDSDIPADFWIRMNTQSWRFIIPELYEKYPDMEMEAVVASASSPSTFINEQGISVLVPAIANVSVILPNGNRHAVFSLSVSLSTSAKVWVNTLRLHGKLNLLSFKFSVVEMEFGEFDAEGLTKVVNEVCNWVIVPFLNVALEKGFDIPMTKGVEVIEPTITYGQGFMVVSTDFKYHL
ncbi:hypothetical protein RCL1_001777 [Eukaryota sp. TZLM3-RCL]